MKESSSISGYAYADPETGHAHNYLLPRVESVLTKHFENHPNESKRVFDLGCGNGSVANYLDSLGYEVTGVDPSTTGIRQANESFPKLSMSVGSAYDDLKARFGQFPALISLEVVEHVYAPRDYARTVADLISPNGIAIISTPYHGYLKNLALALSGRMDKHFTARWDHGHIKFWSIATLSQLFAEQGMVCENAYRVGRIPMLAKSMILVFRKR